MITSVTTHDRKNLYLFALNHYVHSRLLIVIISIYAVFVGAMYALTLDPFYLMVAAVFAAFIVLIVFVIPYISMARTRMLGITNTLTFADDKIDYVSEKEGYRSEGYYSYTAIQKVKRSRTAYYFYLDANTAFIVARDGIAGATEHELEKFLAEKLGRSKIKFSIQE